MIDACILMPASWARCSSQRSSTESKANSKELENADLLGYLDYLDQTSDSSTSPFLCYSSRSQLVRQCRFRQMLVTSVKQATRSELGPIESDECQEQSIVKQDRL